MPSITNQTQADPAAAYVRHTPRQQRQAAARFDREAAETIKAYKAREAQRSAELVVTRAIRTVELLGLPLLTGQIRAGGVYRPLRVSESATCLAAVEDAWWLLRRSRYATARVSVLR